MKGLSQPQAGSCSHQGPCPSRCRPQGSYGHGVLQQRCCALSSSVLTAWVAEAPERQAWPGETGAAGPAQRALAQHAWPIGAAHPALPGHCCTLRRPACDLQGIRTPSMQQRSPAAAGGSMQAAKRPRLASAGTAPAAAATGYSPGAAGLTPRCCCQAQTRAGSCGSSRGWSRPWCCRA